MASTLTIQVLDQKLAICRQAGDAPLPDWCSKGSFISNTRTPEELSLATPLAEAGPAPESYKSIQTILPD